MKNLMFLAAALAPFALGLTTASFAADAPPAAANPQAMNATSQPNISGVWLINNYVVVTHPQNDRRLKTADGQLPPLQPWAAKIYQKRLDDSDKGDAFAVTAAFCLPQGMPAMMLGAPYPFQIIQSPGQVSTIHEEEHAFRLIYLDEKHPTDIDPGFMGNSVGHWEGDTLVVDTIGLNDRTTMDFNGMPHSDELHVIEHIRRLNPTTLEDVLTFDDPKTFERPWSTRRTYKLLSAGDRVMEYVCENQRNTPTANNLSGFGK